MSFLHLTNGKKIYYECVGDWGSDLTLIFLHDGLGSTRAWKDFPELLCNAVGCRGVIYDRLGYGNSSHCDSSRTIHYLHYYGLEELPALIHKTIPESPYVLIGHSDGGSISLIYGAEKPKLLQGIVSIAAHVMVEPETIEGIKAARDAFSQGKLNGLFHYHGDHTPSVFKAWSETWLSSWFASWNIEYLLPSVDCPILVMQGKEDQYGTIRQVNSIVENSAGESEYSLLEKCGHSPHIDQPDNACSVIHQFITRLLK